MRPGTGLGSPAPLLLSTSPIWLRPDNQFTLNLEPAEELKYLDLFLVRVAGPDSMLT